MITRGLRKWALLLTFWLALHSKPLSATDLSVSGDLTVTGTSDFQGDALTFGKRSDNSNPGIDMVYTDGSTSILEFDASRSANIWKWQQNGGASLKLQMVLNNNNSLILYNQASTPLAQITLNPLGTSTFENSVLIKGSDNRMPNQALNYSESVLTRGLGDARYFSKTTNHFSLFQNLSGELASAAFGKYSNASGPSSFAFGYSAQAYGSDSMALGRGAFANKEDSQAFGADAQATGVASIALGAGRAIGVASMALGNQTRALGQTSTAMGDHTAAGGDGSTSMGSYSEAVGIGSFALGDSVTANGDYSTAMGRYSQSNGIDSFALGNYATASGYGSIAMGENPVASGDFSSAVGTQISAPSFAQTTLGQYNVGAMSEGGATQWNPTDPLLEVGNGQINPDTGEVILSDALLLDKSGTLTVTTVKANTIIVAAPGGDIPMYSGN